MAEAELVKWAKGRQLLQIIAAAVPPDARDEVVEAAAALAREAAGEKGTSKQAASLQPQFDEPELAVLPDMTLAVPRGKFTITMRASSLTFVNAKTTFTVMRTALRVVAILDRHPDDKRGVLLLAIGLQPLAGVTVGKTTHHALLFTTKEADTAAVDVQGHGRLAGPLAVVLCQLLGHLHVTDFQSPEAALFSSAAKGAAGIQAIVKVSQGVLFPLPRALVFVERPTLVLHHDDIAWVELQRIGHPASTFDAVVHLNPASLAPGAPRSVEFSQIDRAELPRLQAYLSATKLPLAAPLDATSTRREAGVKPEPGGAAGAAESQEAVSPSQPRQAGRGAAVEESSDDEEDSDFDPDAPDTADSGSEEGGGGGNSSDISVELVEEEGLDGGRIRAPKKRARVQQQGRCTKRQTGAQADEASDDLDDEEEEDEGEGDD